ncbi:MAG TPA: CDP-archaeol synthase, partial [Parachlamydiaceae bacterium]|nr:CDP-archaeol synthase [Parachlamydiaceae bacterium]
YKIAKGKGFLPLETIGIVCSVLYVVAVFLSTQSKTFDFLPEMMLVFTGLLIFTNYFVKDHNPLVNAAITFFAIAYLAMPLACLLNITYFFPAHSVQDGRWWLVFLLVAPKMTDTGAYFIGKRFGHHKLAPYISPGKTWEGAIGGFFAALLAAFLLYYLIHFLYEKPPVDLSLIYSLWLAGVLSVIAQFGDLAESLLKRDALVKDSNQLPGLGGMLDIVDSLVFSAPLMYIYLKIQAS